MSGWPIIIAVYAWLGFTVGYFFRKWMERFVLPAPANAQPVGGGAATDGAGPVEWVDWIDDEDRVLESLPRAEVRRRNLLHRVTHTYLFDPVGRVFVHQRTPTKDVYPGFHDVCVGGTVTTGEDFVTNAFRELEEELGVSGVALFPLFEHRFRDEHTNNHIRVYACRYDGPVRFQPEEVVGGAWTTLEGVDVLIGEGRICPDSARGWGLFRERFPGARPFDDLSAQIEPLAPPPES